jgi:PAS domain S-box-containing protein
LFQTAVNGDVRWVNAAAARIVGYDSPEDFMSNVADIREIYVDPSRRDDFEREIQMRGSASGFDYEIRRKDGAIRWISVSARALIAADGLVEGYEGTVVDITDRKLLDAALIAVSSRLDPEEAVSQFAEILRRVIPFKQVTLAVIEGANYRRMVSISASGTAVTFPQNEIIPLAGNSMQVAVDARRPVVVTDTSQGQWDFDQVLKERGIASYTVLPLVDDTGVFATFNIGAGKPNAFSNDTVSLLESITAGLSNAVRNILLYEREREAHRQMERINYLKSDFVARVTHDLRSPLSVISGIADVTMRAWDRLPEKDRRQKMDVIFRQANRMSELLRRDLEIALIELGELVCKREPFDLAELVRQAIEDLATSEIAHRYELDIPESLPWAVGDRDRNLQVLDNLLSNAIKFSPPGTMIIVRVSRHENTLRVDVQDQGPGIEQDRLDEVFERMFRLDERTEGTGLGLYISKSFVEAQAGDIWVSSAPGEGACFSFTLPIASD